MSLCNLSQFYDTLDLATESQLKFHGIYKFVLAYLSVLCFL